MQSGTPPPLPKTMRAGKSRHTRFLIVLALLPLVFIGPLIGLRICGLVRPFSVPTGAMTPAVSAGDHVLVEGVSFLSREPQRGDIVVFRTDGIASISKATFYVKRIAAEPGEHVRISDGKLFVDGKQVSLSNAVGEIEYNSRPGFGRLSPQTEVTVRSGCYFVLGDNSTNSFDSRFWGSVPRRNIIGRVAFCYWPPHRIGAVK